MRKSTLVSIAVAFLVGIAAVIWVCYASFKGSVMSFEATNAPAPLVTPTPIRPPVAGAAHVAAPAQAQDVFPTLIPTLAPTAPPPIATPPPAGQPGPPPPDG